MAIGARLAVSVSCPECCYRVRPIILMFNADPDRAHVHVQCPREECQRIFDVYKDDDND
jgi:hypothetical protein